MNFDDYRQYDAVGLAALVRTRQVSPDELLDAALARAAAVNPTLNALIEDLEADARAAIADGLPDGALRGVPFPIKDITVKMKGIATGAGSRLFRGRAYDYDSELIASYRRAGLTLFAKTNTPEFGLATVTEPVARGITRNPWSLGHTCGGSSGGAAAAVAAGIVPAAHASDGGGSIRTPASCCALFGLKPSRGRISIAPDADGWGGLAVQHALTRSVRDSALLLDLCSGPRPGDLYAAAEPERPFFSEVGRDPGTLRIGYTTRALIHGTLDPECVAGVMHAARLCETLGHEVEEAVLDVDFVGLAVAANTTVCTSVAATLEAEAAARGRPIDEDEVERLTWSIYEEYKGKSASEYVLAQQTINTIVRRFAAAMARYDVLLLANNGSPPVAVGSIDTNAGDLSDYGERLYRFIPNTQPFNVAGMPAMSVPLHWSAGGLPVGVQFAAPAGHEAVLLRLAAQLEAAQPWFDRTPTEPFAS
ncbi:amidase [Hephaestia sp. GCM10023244]|uniref:amidase n=1 Tax=unclassified Hephaestia TaxID=2631281 RepID=UPI0020777A7E|nr:amidase [Hephaestia sp. MAHUQ-44]MCM8729802.1 amidase [Hephaestia sp. MAHUQ-44]